MNYRLVISAALGGVLCSCGGGGSPADPQLPIIPIGIPEDSARQPLAADELAVLGNGPGRLRIFMPADDAAQRYLEFSFNHEEDSASNTSHWRLMELWETEPLSLSEPLRFRRLHDGQALANSGSWELAIRETGAADFVGGNHGNILAGSVTARLDGVELGLDQLPGRHGRNLEIVQRGQLFSGMDGCLLAKYSQTHLFSCGRLRLTQTMDWQHSARLEHAYLAMLPLRRRLADGAQITDSLLRLPGSTLEDVSLPGFAELHTMDTQAMKLSGRDAGLAVQLSIISRTQLTGYNVFISNSPQYNKLYFDLCGEYATRPGEQWLMDAEYSFHLGTSG